MTRLGENDSVDDDLCKTLRKFVCTIFRGRRTKDVNALRFNKLIVKQSRENKYVDLSALPPCQATLKLHILRANRVAYLIKNTSFAEDEEPALSDCGEMMKEDNLNWGTVSQRCRGAVVWQHWWKWRRQSWRVFWRWLHEWRTWLKFEWHLLGLLLFAFDILEI